MLSRCALLVRVLAGLAAVCAAGAASAAGPVLKLQDPRSGATVTVEAAGPALHLALFATWCQPCREELDRLEVLEERFGEHGYRLVLIAVPTRQTRERLVRFLEDQSPPGELLFDAAGDAQKILGAGHLPTHIILDARGQEVLRAERLSDRVDEVLERLMLGESP